MQKSIQRILSWCLGLFLGGFCLVATPAQAGDITPDLTPGAQLFSLHCAGCHINGGNIIRRGKNLKLKALQANHVDTVEAIASLVTNGKNNMSAYRDRLTPEEIETVAAYVLQQAQQDWK